MARGAELQGVPGLSRPVRWLRRRRMIRRYLNAVALEVLGTTTSVEEVERRATSRVDLLYQQATKELVDRSDILVKELDRKIEGITTRQQAEIRRLREEVSELKSRLAGLEPSSLPTRAEEPPPSSGPSPAS